MSPHAACAVAGGRHSDPFTRPSASYRPSGAGNSGKASLGRSLRSRHARRIIPAVRTITGNCLCGSRGAHAQKSAHHLPLATLGNWEVLTAASGRFPTVIKEIGVLLNRITHDDCFHL